MPHHGMTPHTSGSSLSAQARYAAGTREILECHFAGRPIRDEYLIVEGGALAGAGAHSYSEGDATGGSEEAARFARKGSGLGSEAGLGFSNVHGIPGLPAVSREARILDGRAAAEDACERVADQVGDRLAAGELAPSLATIDVGHAPASEACVAALDRACGEAGVSFSLHRFEAGGRPGDAWRPASPPLNADPTVSGILFQLPRAERLVRGRCSERSSRTRTSTAWAWPTRPGSPRARSARVPATAKGDPGAAAITTASSSRGGGPSSSAARSWSGGRSRPLLNQRDSTGDGLPLAKPGARRRNAGGPTC